MTDNILDITKQCTSGDNITCFFMDFVDPIEELLNTVDEVSTRLIPVIDQHAETVTLEALEERLEVSNDGLTSTSGTWKTHPADIAQQLSTVIDQLRPEYNLGQKMLVWQNSMKNLVDYAQQITDYRVHTLRKEQCLREENNNNVDPSLN